MELRALYFRFNPHPYALRFCQRLAEFILSQAFNCLKPGAWLDQFEISIQFKSDDGSLRPGSALERWVDVSYEAADKIGQTLKTAEFMKGQIEDAGFVNVTERIIKGPIGNWPTDKKEKEIGTFGRLQLEIGLEGFALALLTRVMGVSAWRWFVGGDEVC